MSFREKQIEVMDGIIEKFLNTPQDSDCYEEYLEGFSDELYEASALKHVEGLVNQLEIVRNMLSYYRIDNIDETKIPYSVAEHLILIRKNADNFLHTLPAELRGEG